VNNYRDLVIDALADAEAALSARVVELVLERDSYWLLARAGIKALHGVTLERDQLRATNRRLLDLYRRTLRNSAANRGGRDRR
jgi:hypothetical protein